MYENVYPNLTLVLLFVRTEVECGKGLLEADKAGWTGRTIASSSWTVQNWPIEKNHSPLIYNVY